MRDEAAIRFCVILLAVTPRHRSANHVHQLQQIIPLGILYFTIKRGGVSARTRCRRPKNPVAWLNSISARRTLSNTVDIYNAMRYSLGT
jgi:hypothetical protein